MRTETKEIITTVKVPWSVTIKGNDSGCPVQSHPSSKSPGDGDINTGKGGVVYAWLNASCKADGNYAKLSFNYSVQTSDYGSGKKADYLSFSSVRYVNLAAYNYVPGTWTYVNEKNEKVTVQERFTWKMGSAPDAYYLDYYKAKDSRHGYLKVDNSYPQQNKAQSWIPREELRFKIDDSGSELTKVGNIAFQAKGYVPIRVTRTITSTYETLIDDTAQTILSRDNALTNPTLDALLNNRPIVTLEDGTRNFANMVIHDAGSTGAWLRGTREEQLGVVTYAFPHSVTNMAPSTDYYLGSVILVDNKFRSAQPSKIVFKDTERKPLSMYATNSRVNHYFDNVLPTAKEMNNRRNDFVQNYLKKISSNTQVPSVTMIDYKDFESTDGISIGGSIKGVDFGFSTGERKKRVRVYTFKQVLYTMALDDTYKKGSEFFSDKLDVKAFRSAMKHYSPAIISNVYFGKIAYLAIASDDKSALSVTISKANFANGTASIAGSTKNCTFKALVIGGTAGSMNGNMKFDDLRDANNFVASICKEMTAGDVEAAVPIEFEAKYLRNPAKKVTTNVYKYFSKYVDKIKFNIWESNKGISASAKLRCLDYGYDSKGKMDYVFRYWDRGLDYSEWVSPWACCFEIKVDIVGTTDYDFNIFVPYIPLSLLTQDDNGDWVFKVHITGSTYHNAKNNVATSHTVPGCYVNGNNKYFRGSLPESSYKGKTEEAVLTDFFNYCEEMWLKESSFHRLTSEKRIKSCRGND